MTLKILWARLADIEAKSGMKCGRPGKCNADCCHPSIMGGVPGVTPPEAELINSFLATQQGFRFSEAGEDGCKFLGKDGLCRIYSVRPIDCRVHFCKENSLESQPNPEIVHLVAEYHSRHEAAFMETELIDSFRFLGES
ncbi:MAG: YkgJ family cysteine cluster protein [Desulfobulbaceae bacterium]|nr:YkgJ family cysteine cluster protein [Desulfobulbaceae bacterium]HIJ90621.1 YkgJ family cysteine cluster protein [Deltaproteobacteria bacterium]